uniref:Uncharacterized protein n=1 Tax=Manihot esculenta TaxID=3983 RepID=A0A2C9V5B1_MANES
MILFQEDHSFCCCGYSTFPAASGAIVANSLLSVSQHSQLVWKYSVFVVVCSNRFGGIHYI